MESDDRMDGSPVLIGLLIFLVCCSAFFPEQDSSAEHGGGKCKKCGFDYASVGRPEPLAEFHSGWE
mgnify:CR=1 FL=1